MYRVPSKDDGSAVTNSREDIPDRTRYLCCRYELRHAKVEIELFVVYEVSIAHSYEVFDNKVTGVDLLAGCARADPNARRRYQSPRPGSGYAHGPRGSVRQW